MGDAFHATFRSSSRVQVPRVTWRLRTRYNGVARDAYLDQGLPRKERSIMSLDLVETLSELVAIPSVNPMGRPLSGPEYFEHRVTEYLAGLFHRLKLPFQRQTVEPGRDNIIARLEGTPSPEQGGSLVLLEAHQDTVPVDGMTIDPWDPVIREGRLYGRGSCDIKGGMTAMLGALARLAEERPAGMPTILMACTVNEEHGFSGATALTQLWTGEKDSIIPRRPDAAIVAEPTLLDVVVAHKGAARWRLHTAGRAAHSSRPDRGDNAIYRMARVLTALETYARDVAPTGHEHALCGGPSLSVGTIQGGLSVNTVPDACAIEIDRRVVPGEDAAAAFQEVVDYLECSPELDFKPRHDTPFLGRPLPDDDNGPLADRLAEVARRLFGRCDKIGVPYGTDASTIAAAGVPSVVFGPGSIDQAHTIDEWVELEQITKASEAIHEFIARGLD